MAKAKNNVLYAKKIQGFTPQDYFQDGIDENGKVYRYLPYNARNLWYNLYAENTGKKFSLTAEKLENDNPSMLHYKATLVEYVGENLTPITISTGEATVMSNVEYAHELCETRAKARALGSAGFNLPEENLLNDDITSNDKKSAENKARLDNKEKKANDKSNPSSENVSKAKKTVKKAEQIAFEEEEKETNVEEEKDNETKKDFLPIPDIENIANFQTEEDKLERCLKAFFPYGIFKGDQVIDLITNPKFVSQVQKMSYNNFEDCEMEDGLKTNDFINTILKYLVNPTKDDTELLIKVTKKIKEEE